eukprot:12585903-Alexandrium_andersonii.AAC.1
MAMAAPCGGALALPPCAELPSRAARRRARYRRTAVRQAILQSLDLRQALVSEVVQIAYPNGSSDRN